VLRVHRWWVLRGGDEGLLRRPVDDWRSRTAHSSAALAQEGGGWRGGDLVVGASASLALQAADGPRRRSCKNRSGKVGCSRYKESWMLEQEESQAAAHERQTVASLEGRHLDGVYRLGRIPYFAYLGRQRGLGRRLALGTRQV
jgi:hypothetical protein